MIVSASWWPPSLVMPMLLIAACLFALFDEVHLVEIAAEAAPPTEVRPSPLLLVILDGFSYDYARNLSGLTTFQQNASSAEYLIPVFPSLKYPSLYSILTGLYPENHGIVADVMYDPNTSTYFYDGLDAELSNSSWWNGSVPIWATAKKDGRRVSVYSLSMCNVRMQDMPLPDVCHLHRGASLSESLEMDLNDAVQNLAKGASDFAIVRSDILDEQGRIYGPKSSEVLMAVVDVDEHINKLVKLIESTGLQDKLNVIITSSHGMAAVDLSPKQHIHLGKISTNDTAPGVLFDDLEFLLSYGAFVGVYPKMDKFDKVFKDLEQIEGVVVYKRKDIPEDLHIKWNNRTAPVVVIAKKGYYIDQATFAKKQLPPAATKSISIVNGASGYIPTEVHEMRGIFYAKGPDVEAKTVTSINAVDIYEMMTCLLNVTGHPSNSSAKTVCDLLKIDCPSVCDRHHNAHGHSGADSISKVFKTDSLWAITAAIVLFSVAFN